MVKTLLCVILPIFSKEVLHKCLEIKLPVLKKKSSNRCVKADGLFIYDFNKNSVFLIKSCVIDPTCKAQQRKTRSGLYAHTYQVLIVQSAPAPAPRLASNALPPSHPNARAAWMRVGSWGFSLAPGRTMSTLLSFPLATFLPASKKILMLNIDVIMKKITEVLPLAVGRCLSLI